MNELNIRQERISRGWTQVYVGQQVGVSKVAIHDIETGKQKPSYDVLLKLLALFKVEHKNVARLFAAADDTQPDYSNSKLDGIERMKELDGSLRNFDHRDIGVVVDVLRDGRLDDPESRDTAVKARDALNAVLDGAA
jgi:transcriptional regulator with XRE-family HTH domain